MSYEGDNQDHQRELEVQNDQIIMLLKAILLALEIGIDRDHELLDEVD